MPRKSALALAVGNHSETPDSPVPLPHMTPAAKRVWRDVCQSMPPGWFINCDREILEQYCEAVAMFRDAMKMIKRDGYVAERQIRDKHGNIIATQPVPHPALKLKEQGASTVRILSARLGLGPSTRNSRDKGRLAWDEGKKASAKALPRLVRPSADSDEDDDLLFTGKPVGVGEYEV